MQQRFKARCACQVVITDSFKQTEKVVFPCETEVSLWKENKRRPKGQKASCFPRPPCPMEMGLCPLYRPFEDLQALRVRIQNALRSDEKWTVFSVKRKAAKRLTKKHCMELQYNPRFAEIDWEADIAALYGLVDLEADVPPIPPDEPYTEYTPEEFLTLFGFEMEADYAKSRFFDLDDFQTTAEPLVDKS